MAAQNKQNFRTRTGYNGAGKITITVNKVDWVREWGSLGQLPRDEIQTKLDELELSKAGFDENGLWSNDLTNENEKPAPLKVRASFCCFCETSSCRLKLK